MYPFIRMFKALWQVRSAPPMAFHETHISQHRCWPQDIDLWMELNNGRTLTLYDLGRIPLAKRTGLIGALRTQRWGLTMAGVSVRYRRRIRTFEAFSIKSRAVCWDDKFMYLEQAMVKRSGEVANHALYRAAVTDKNGIVSPTRVLEMMGSDAKSPPMPDWIANWVKADATRSWPPMQDLSQD
ncbi:acyl-CoA thioesterase [Planktotalea arctica]|uniref:acyl-CoA thioesterase n=1 Tax=Planktotalea arctica TaxID=1481893 RepID=UPI000A1763A9|nr:acyl-CoA thioesterase [Planktotalea arctica]